MKIERSSNYLIYRIAFTHILTVIAIMMSANILAISILWIGSAVLPNCLLWFNKNLKAIELGENSIYLIFSRQFGQIDEQYEYETLKFTNKIETGPRGSKTREFRIYKIKDEKLIVHSLGFFDGWTDNKINDVIFELHKKGIDVIEF